MNRIVFALAFVVGLGSFDAMARDRGQVRAFKAHNACPSTDKFRGSCPGFVVDHIVPLCAGGFDGPKNMQWQSYADSRVKDGREIRFCACKRAARKVCLPI